MSLLLKQYIKLLIENWHEEVYTHDIVDDPAFNQDSVFVPNDVKKQIKKYLSTMGLSKRPQKKTKRL